MAELVTSGAAVTGTSSFQVCFRFKPRTPTSAFSDPNPPPPMCGPIILDTTTAAVVNLGSVLRPKWALQISWVTTGPRLLVWTSDR